jgi:hypothetical protein
MNDTLWNLNEWIQLFLARGPNQGVEVQPWPWRIPASWSTVKVQGAWGQHSIGRMSAPWTVSIDPSLYSGHGLNLASHQCVLERVREGGVQAVQASTCCATSRGSRVLRVTRIPGAFLPGAFVWWYFFKIFFMFCNCTGPTIVTVWQLVVYMYQHSTRFV